MGRPPSGRVSNEKSFTKMGLARAIPVARSTNTKSFPSFIEASEKIRTSIILAPARPDGTVFMGTLVELGAIWYALALDSPRLYYTAWYDPRSEERRVGKE